MREIYRTFFVTIVYCMSISAIVYCMSIAGLSWLVPNDAEEEKGEGEVST